MLVQEVIDLCVVDLPEVTENSALECAALNRDSIGDTADSAYTGEMDSDMTRDTVGEHTLFD